MLKKDLKSEMTMASKKLEGKIGMLKK